MATIYGKHLPYEDGHLGEVTAEMMGLGAPTIAVVEIAGEFVALEGSHRLAACDHLGLRPLLLTQEAELDEGRDEYWRQVKASLPRYTLEAIVMRPFS